MAPYAGDKPLEDFLEGMLLFGYLDEIGDGSRPEDIVTEGERKFRRAITGISLLSEIKPVDMMQGIDCPGKSRISHGGTLTGMNSRNLKTENADCLDLWIG